MSGPAVADRPVSAPPLALGREPARRSGPVYFLRQLFRKRPAQIGGVLVLVLLLMAIFADVVSPYNPIRVDAPNRLQGPSSAHLFGTDQLGRDVFSRIVYGSRVTLQVGTIAVLIAMTFSIVVGTLSGFYGGWLDLVLMRLIEIMLAFPGFLLALVIIATLGPGLQNAMIAVGIGAGPGFARVIRGSVLGVKGSEYVTAARVLGASDFRIMRDAILPNVLAPIIVLATLEFPVAVLVAASLSFLGLGAQPPMPEWGSMLVDGRVEIRTAPWLINFPGLAIFITILGFNLLGNSLRDVLDPRLRES